MAASDILFADVSKLLFSDVRDIVKLAGKEAGRKDAAAWLAGLDDAPPEKVAIELAERLTEALAREKDPSKRLALLNGCEAAAATALAALELATEIAPLPLPAAAMQAAVAADSLLKVMATDYAGLALGLQDKVGGPDDARELLRLAALRAMHALARREVLAYRGHAVPSPASWKLMQDVYSVARAQGVAGPDKDGAAVEHEYVAALLLALADPARLPRTALAAAHAFIAGLAPHARIEAAALPREDVSCRFLIATDKARPALPLAQIEDDKALPPHSLVLNCSGLPPRIEQLLAAGGEAAPLPPEVMRLLNDAWSAAAAPARRFSRTQFKQHIDVIAGLPTILRLLSGRSLGRRQSDTAHADEGDASEWLVINESPDGFGIQHLNGKAPVLAIGDVVMLRPREQGKFHICLVRRYSPAPQGAELGVQLLCSEATVLPLPSEDILAMGQQGLLLLRLPAFGNAAGLITAPGALTPRSVITDNQEGTLKYYGLGSRIATSTAIEFHLLQSS
jgi:cyclic-di-GMP-binding protein